MQTEWKGPKFAGKIVRVAVWCGRETTPGTFEPSPLDHVDAWSRDDGAIVSCYRGEVIEIELRSMDDRGPCGYPVT